MRKSGWKTVSLLAENATAALKNSMYAKVFNAVDSAIASGANYGTASSVTEAAMDALAVYTMEHSDGDAVILANTKYILAASKLVPASDAMKEEMYRNGFLGKYGSIPMKAMNSAKKVQGQAMFPDQRIFGIGKPIGRLDMKGEIHTYQDEENARERIQLYWKDFTFGVAYNPSGLLNVYKLVIS